MRDTWIEMVEFLGCLALIAWALWLAYLTWGDRD
jgi:hypothetical protein